MLKDRLLKAVIASDVFGDDVESAYRKMAMECHPDRGGDAGTFALLNQWKEISDFPKVIESSKAQYVLGLPIGTGDVSDVYGAGCGDKRFVVKISRQGRSSINRLLAKEVEVLSQLHEKGEDSLMPSYFPKVADSFEMEGKRVSVLVYDHEWMPCSRIRAKNQQLDPRHVVWIFKRMMTAIGYANQCGWVHSAITPENVLINPSNHGVRLISWTLAKQAGKPVDLMSAAYEKWYPPETKTKGPSGMFTDIYMASRTLCWIAGGGMNVPNYLPERIRLMLHGCILDSPKMRPQDAWELHDEMDELARSMYGEPRFIELTV